MNVRINIGIRRISGNYVLIKTTQIKLLQSISRSEEAQNNESLKIKTSSRSVFLNSK